MGKLRARVFAFGIGVAACLGFSPAAGAAPAQVQFNLQDGNTTVGFRYDPPRAHHGGPLLIMIHGASDTHTVFDFFPGFRPRRSWRRWACRC